MGENNDYYELSVMKMHFAVLKKNRLYELDVFRGVAALWVLLFHYTVRYSQMYEPYSSDPLIKITNGRLPVQLFFMISGFVIFMTLENCDSWKSFAVSRFTRLYPIFWVSVALTAIVGSVVPLPGQNYTFVQVLLNLSMLQGYLYVPAVDGVYWSLSYELGFYIVVLCLFQARFLSGSLLIVCFFWIVLGAAANLYSDFLWYRIRLLLVLPYAHLFVAGILFYDVWKKGFSLYRTILIIMCIVSSYLGYHSDMYSMMSVIVFFVFFYLAVIGALRGIIWWPLVWLGEISYSLYLTHQMLGYRVIFSLTKSGYSSNVSIIISTVAALLLAHFLTFYVERPVIRVLRQKLS